MGLTAHIMRISLCLAILFLVGHSSQVTERDSSFVNEVFKDFPTAECDTIVVSSSPLFGEISPAYFKELSMSATGLNGIQFRYWKEFLFLHQPEATV